MKKKTAVGIGIACFLAAIFGSAAMAEDLPLREYLRERFENIDDRLEKQAALLEVMQRIMYQVNANTLDIDSVTLKQEELERRQERLLVEVGEQKKKIGALVSICKWVAGVLVTMLCAWIGNKKLGWTIAERIGPSTVSSQIKEDGGKKKGV